jgi:uncharacterized membrane protein
MHALTSGHNNELNLKFAAAYIVIRKSFITVFALLTRKTKCTNNCFQFSLYWYMVAIVCVLSFVFPHQQLTVYVLVMLRHKLRKSMVEATLDTRGGGGDFS